MRGFFEFVFLEWRDEQFGRYPWCFATNRYWITGSGRNDDEEDSRYRIGALRNYPAGAVTYHLFRCDGPDFARAGVVPTSACRVQRKAFQLLEISYHGDGRTGAIASAP